MKKRRLDEALRIEAQVSNPVETVVFNPRLRYNEKLQLNRKGTTAAFRSMTRTKRNHVPDGQGVIRDEVPDIG